MLTPIIEDGPRGPSSSHSLRSTLLLEQGWIVIGLTMTLPLHPIVEIKSWCLIIWEWTAGVAVLGTLQLVDFLLQVIKPLLQHAKTLIDHLWGHARLGIVGGVGIGLV